MGITTAITAIGVIAGIYGGVKQRQEVKKANADRKAGEDRANAARKRQADLEAMRARRQQLRESMAQRANILSSATVGGAQFGSGAITGAGNQTSAAAGNIQGINQGQELGAEIFAGQAQASAAQPGTSGQAWQSIGGALVSAAPAFGRIGNFIGGQSNDPWRGMRTVG